MMLIWVPERVYAAMWREGGSEKVGRAKDRERGERVKQSYSDAYIWILKCIGSLTAQRRNFLLRDVYDDIMLDGIQPTRDTFHSLIVGTMKGARLQDAFFFRDEMKAMGFFIQFLISVGGKCKHSDHAVHILEEMKKNEVKPNGQTYICLLNAFAATGQLDPIVRDVTAAGLGLNKFCYAALITAHKNKKPTTQETAAKLIVELVEQSKGWSEVDGPTSAAENMMMGVSEEELYNLPTAEDVNRRGAFLARQLTIYHVALYACADLRNVEVLWKKFLDMLKKDGRTPDVFTVMQVMRCYLHSGDIDRGLKILILGAMDGYTPKGMQIAQDALVRLGLPLVQMNSRNFFLNPKTGSDLLLAAAGEKMGGYTTANFIWDLMQARKIVPTLPVVEAYYNGLKEREIPEDDPRLTLVSRTYDKLRLRLGPGAAQRT
ncbi:Pentatricopeptide repeat [Dillenia turbinata]|uniref:Pentatricopeptide repeat n=1 Tax=Dillenia turbinata TaxID=194707 RepID=A0AAN8V6F7_9MAGN